MVIILVNTDVLCTTKDAVSTALISAVLENIGRQHSQISLETQANFLVVVPYKTM